jgi:hypothetical protein
MSKKKDAPIADAIPFDPKAAWESASPELRKLGKDVFRNAMTLGVRYFEGIPSLTSKPVASEGSDLDKALARADALDDKLANEVRKRAEAAAFAKTVFDASLQIAIKAAIAGIKMP